MCVCTHAHTYTHTHTCKHAHTSAYTFHAHKCKLCVVETLLSSTVSSAPWTVPGKKGKLSKYLLDEWMKMLPHLIFIITVWSKYNIHNILLFLQLAKLEALTPAQGCIASYWPNQNLNSDFLFSYSFLSVFWEFAILIAKQEMSHQENLFPNLNLWCVHKKVTFQSNGNTDCAIFRRKSLSFPSSWLLLAYVWHMRTRTMQLSACTFPGSC